MKELPVLRGGDSGRGDHLPALWARAEGRGSADGRSTPVVEAMTCAHRICVRDAVLIGLCLVAAQCGDNAPTVPTEFLSGLWTGTLQSSTSGPATGLVTITQIGSSLTGTWSIDATSLAGASDGSLFGMVTGQDVSIALTPSDPLTCSFGVTATVTGNTITGTYVTFNCTVALSGNISLTRVTVAFEEPA